jgi:integrase
LNQLQLGEITETEKITFGEYMESWLAKKKKNVTYGTYRHYESYTRNHIIPGLGKWPTTKLKDIHITSFMDSLEEKELSRRTQRHIFRILSSAISNGGRYGLNKNLFNNIEAPKVPKKKIEFWNENEAQIFVKTLMTEKHYMPIYLALMTGMRQGEVLGLRWDSIDFEQRILSVQQQLKIKEELDGQGRYELTNVLKTPTSYRTTSLDEETILLLKKHKANQEKRQNRILTKYAYYNLVNATDTGNYITPPNLNKVFWRTIENAGVKRISFHSLRHTHATLLLKMGVHPKVVQERLGHASIQITLDTYSHLIPGMQSAAADMLGSLFKSH